MAHITFCLPSDPRSTINKANLVQTCGKCHPGANANFAASKMHIAPKQPISGA